MFDIKWIRENPDLFDAGLKKRDIDPLSSSLIEKDDARKAHIQKLQDAQERRNTASKEIGKAKGSGDHEKADKLIAEVAELKSFLQGAEEEGRRLDLELKDALSVIPNLPLDDVPIGADEEANVERHKYGQFKTQLDAAKEHFELGESLGAMEFERAARIAGSRFTILTGPLAKMERALANFMIDLHTTEHGYLEVQPPLLVRDHVLYGTSQLPKFEEDLFKTTDGRYLIPTAEVPLTNYVREEIVAEAELPLRMTALTPCFRSEAGSAGRDVRGMLRQHQFNKCELVSITTPERSIEEHERMLSCAEEVLKRLDLHYRVVTLSTGDMGFGAQKTYDIEVWLPGQKMYREISSCSVCGDFQARRMETRYRPTQGGPLRYVHTLNGSGVAVGRALIAVMENYQNSDGSLSVPTVLQQAMGTDRIDIPG